MQSRIAPAIQSTGSVNAHKAVNDASDADAAKQSLKRLQGRAERQREAGVPLRIAHLRFHQTRSDASRLRW